jgi:rhodanese-related sulfurtransferase
MACTRKPTTETTTPMIPPTPEELAKQNFDLPEIPRILCEQLKQMIDESDEFVLVDTRLSSSFTLGHIPGAIIIPAEDPAFTQEWVDNQLGALPTNKMIIFYCD